MNIQGSINQVIGQSTAAVGLVKHIKQQEELAEEQKAMHLDALKKEQIDLQAKIPELKEIASNKQEELQQLKQEKDLLEQGKIPLGNGFYQDDINGQITSKDIEKAKSAIGTAEGKLKAIKAQRKLFKERLDVIKGELGGDK